MWLLHLENSSLHELCFIVINELCELSCNVEDQERPGGRWMTAPQ
jgi:hypothetical protein